MIIAVIGNAGQLASELKSLATDHTLLTFGRDDIDLSDMSNITQVLDQANAEAVINTAAYTNVDAAESNEHEAHILNSIAPKNLAEYCSSRNIKLVHVSTDFVFDGQSSTPYTRSHKIAPLGVYGKTKAEGEHNIEQTTPLNYCIIRTSWLFSTFGQNFVKTILRLIKEKPSINIIADQIGTPTYAKDLAKACVYAATSDLRGIQHWTDLGVASWYDFALAIQQIAYEHQLIKKTIPITPIPTSEYPTPAKRPHYSVLNKDENARLFVGIEANHWRENLSKMIKELKSEI